MVEFAEGGKGSSNTPRKGRVCERLRAPRVSEKRGGGGWGVSRRPEVRRRGGDKEKGEARKDSGLDGLRSEVDKHAPGPRFTPPALTAKKP